MNHKIETVGDAERILHRHGFRLTAQRKIILEVLLVRGWHLTAEEIYREARHRNHHINLATIYRTLTTLRETGLVQQYYISPDHSESRFRLIEPPEAERIPPARPISESFHFHCLNCGQITVLHNPELVNVVQRTLDTYHAGFDLKQICMCAEGLCPRCAKAVR